MNELPWREVRYKIDSDKDPPGQLFDLLRQPERLHGRPDPDGRGIQRGDREQRHKTVRARSEGRLIIHSHDWMAGGDYRLRQCDRPAHSYRAQRFHGLPSRWICWAGSVFAASSDRLLFHRDVREGVHRLCGDHDQECHHDRISSARNSCGRLSRTTFWIGILLPPVFARSGNTPCPAYNPFRSGWGRRVRSGGISSGKRGILTRRSPLFFGLVQKVQNAPIAFFHCVHYKF